MEQNMPIIAKELWKIVKLLYFMLRKGISKGKLLAELTMLMKRGKLAGKAAIHNLIHHHHHHHRGESSTNDVQQFSSSTSRNEYEFSCSNSPAYPIFHLKKRRQNSSDAQQPIDAKLWAVTIEMINSAAASPALPGFGPSPMVRQLRITDSPFPLKDFEVDNHVDEAAEKFIMKFYNDLKKQNAMGSYS